ncbi:peroxisome biogenesis factor 10-like [Oscarella lobularis]|uniref:peroxisome biogenesis factor 10-like n=1 Tax=Oscarella lobularis TaxID=121494 RepID=UPI0033131532
MSSSAVFSPAGQPELIRANQKDHQYLYVFRKQFITAIESIFGNSPWIRWTGELSVLSDALYFGLTTICGYQTLGEEYCNIVQVDPSKAQIPSTWRRVAMVSLQILVPYVVKKILDKTTSAASSLADDEQQQRALAVVAVSRKIIQVLHRTHLAVFYLNGVYYHISKRFTGISYVLARHSLVSDSNSFLGYRLIGGLATLQLGLALAQWMYKACMESVEKPTSTKRDDNATEDVHYSFGKCPLCLGQRKSPASTPCGHIFCWFCIVEWTTSKPECPVCRETVQPSRVVCLQNYIPSS